MANNLFDKIMGKAPVPEVNTAVEENVEPAAEEHAGPAEEKKAKDAEEKVKFAEEEWKVQQPEKKAEAEKEESTEPPVEKETEPEKAEKEENADQQPEGEKEPAAKEDFEVILDRMLKSAGKRDPERTEEPAVKFVPEGETGAGSTRPYIKNTGKVPNDGKEEEEKAAAAAPSQVILIDLVLDNTISMKIYYKVLYNKLFDLINGIHKAAGKAGGNVQVRYGITYIRPGEPITEADFSEDGFTENVLKVMEKLKTITFSGGADNGRENINGAVRMSLEKLSTADPGNAKCGILLFTDSMPEEEDMAPDFRDCAELRFARCFVNDDRDYIPDFRTVDHDGRADSRMVNDTKINTLEYFLNEDADRIMPEVISDILEQVSVSVK